VLRVLLKVPVTSFAEVGDSYSLSRSLESTDIDEPTSFTSSLKLTLQELVSHMNCLGHLQLYDSTDDLQYHLETLTLIVSNSDVCIERPNDGVVTEDIFRGFFVSLSNMSGQSYCEKNLLRHLVPFIRNLVNKKPILLSSQSFRDICFSFRNLKGLNDLENEECQLYLSLFVNQLSRRNNQYIPINGKDLSYIVFGLQHISVTNIIQTSYVRSLTRLFTTNMRHNTNNNKFLAITTVHTIGKCTYGMKEIIRGRRNMENPNGLSDKGVDNPYGLSSDQMKARNRFIEVVTHIFSHYHSSKDHFRNQSVINLSDMNGGMMSNNEREKYAVATQEAVDLNILKVSPESSYASECDLELDKISFMLMCRGIFQLRGNNIIELQLLQELCNYISNDRKVLDLSIQDGLLVVQCLQYLSGNSQQEKLFIQNVLNKLKSSSNRKTQIDDVVIKKEDFVTLTQAIGNFNLSCSTGIFYEMLNFCTSTFVNEKVDENILSLEDIGNIVNSVRHMIGIHADEQSYIVAITNRMKGSCEHLSRCHQSEISISGDVFDRISTGLQIVDLNSEAARNLIDLLESHISYKHHNDL